MSYVQVGVRIRELREIKHYSREMLAEKIDLSAKFLYEIELGKKGFSAETLCRLSKALSVSCDYIMFGEESENYNVEKIACALETLEPEQMEKMHDIIKVLYEICKAL
ncbi:MAG: helix-turn-helix transcriptional regulator [Lachnospiraceae bacterium]|nr:helix-turn-helix transcriptional regulator [Lachnospiraceae bacterium]